MKYDAYSVRSKGFTCSFYTNSPHRTGLAHVIFICYCYFQLFHAWYSCTLLLRQWPCSLQGRYYSSHEQQLHSDMPVPVQKNHSPVSDIIFGMDATWSKNSIMHSWGYVLVRSHILLECMWQIHWCRLWAWWFINLLIIFDKYLESANMLCQCTTRATENEKNFT